MADQGTVGGKLADHHREGELLAEQGTIGGIPADSGTERRILTEHNIQNGYYNKIAKRERNTSSFWK